MRRPGGRAQRVPRTGRPPHVIFGRSQIGHGFARLMNIGDSEKVYWHIGKQNRSEMEGAPGLPDFRLTDAGQGLGETRNQMTGLKGDKKAEASLFVPVKRPPRRRGS